MEIGSLKFQKLVVLLIAILFGFIFSLDEWEMLFFGYYQHSLWLQITLTLFQFTSFTAFGWYIWYLNLFEKKRAKKWNLLLSLLVLIAFIGIQALFIEPIADELNEIIYESRDRRHRQFHDDFDDWSTKTVVLFFICHISSWIFLLIRNKAEIEKNYEKLQKEAMQSQISALTNQINPHFFFNSLNSLYSLVFNDNKEKSLEYITKMSGVFRYILQSDEKRLVPLKEEMNFLDTYMFMLTVKYDRKLSIIKSDYETTAPYLLPVLSLLPLIENVIKHNEISNQYPMIIDIYIDKEEHLVVSNEKRERLDAVSVGVGLKNLNNRFRLIAGKDIVIEDTDNRFTVRLPLIKAEKT
ncbi:histidine kinase [Parabacteroides sp. OttesenSCG-928-G21]|nr:histidine kinase [Parabacteroides sp. OttesenSCG-928-G21]